MAIKSKTTNNFINRYINDWEKPKPVVGKTRFHISNIAYEIVILLAGGDKSTQQQDIRTAIELARDIKGEQWPLH